MPKTNFKKELKSSLIIIIFIIISYCIARLIDLPDNNNLFYFTIGGYIALLLIFIFLNIYIKNKILNKITNIISFPASIFLGIASVIMPFWAILIHLIIYFAIAYCIPMIVLGAISHFGSPDFLKESTRTYIHITSGVFICVLFNSVLLRIIYLFPYSSKSRKEYKSTDPLHEPSVYLLSVRNVKFFIYAGYVFTLVLINFLNFQGSSLTAGQNIDQTIIASFETFIAFDGSLGLLKLLDFRPSNLLDKILNAIKKNLPEQDEEEKREEKNQEK